MNITANLPNVTPMNLHPQVESVERQNAAQERVPQIAQTMSGGASSETASWKDREQPKGDRVELGNQTDNGEGLVYDARGSVKGKSEGDQDSEGKRDDGKDGDKKSSSSAAKSASGKELTEEEQKKVQEMKSRDQEVLVHEQAHKAAGGAYAQAPVYETEKGPDGKEYRTEGHVDISVSEEDTPEKTIAKMQKVYAAALAPAQPSAADRGVAASAKQKEAAARAEMAKEASQKPDSADSGKVGESANAKVSGSGDKDGESIPTASHDDNAKMSSRRMAISNRYNSSWNGTAYGGSSIYA